MVLARQNMLLGYSVRSFEWLCTSNGASLFYFSTRILSSRDCNQMGVFYLAFQLDYP